MEKKRQHITRSPVSKIGQQKCNYAPRKEK